MKLKIEYVSKDELKPYLNNAKIHTGEQVEQIKKSISQFGFNDPIAVWKDNEIIEGHGRLLAVMEMDDIDTVPIIRLDDLTDEQRRAYMLVHNQLTLNTGYDFVLLQEELDTILSVDMTELGFALEQIDDIDDIGDLLADKEEDEEEVESEDDEDKVIVVRCPHCGEVVKVI